MKIIVFLQKESILYKRLFNYNDDFITGCFFMPFPLYLRCIERAFLRF